MAPHARLAAYRVMWQSDGDDCNIIAAIEMLVSDGVDIISFSLGRSERPFYNDAYAIGAFKVTAKGVFFSASASTDGPVPSVIDNTAPWIMTVIDRNFPATLRLGNDEMHRGSSLSQATQVTQRLPLLYLSHNQSTRRCQSTLDLSMVNGKILLCDLPYVTDSLASSVLTEVSTAAKQDVVAGFIYVTDSVYGAQELIFENISPPYITVSYAVGN
ncbi:hypothetical protein SUGI_0125070 [Cryptomeria japonica]|nr:hypothetical protein SUGI_0125070 [Cryptomeria japonica]